VAALGDDDGVAAAAAGDGAVAAAGDGAAEAEAVAGAVMEDARDPTREQKDYLVLVSRQKTPEKQLQPPKSSKHL